MAQFRSLGLAETEARSLAAEWWKEVVAGVRVRFEQSIVQARGEEGQYWPELLRVVNWWTRVRVDELVRVSAGELADGSRRGVAVVSRTTSSIPLEMIANPRDWRSVVLLQTPNQLVRFGSNRQRTTRSLLLQRMFRSR